MPHDFTHNEDNADLKIGLHINEITVSDRALIDEINAKERAQRDADFGPYGDATTPGFFKLPETTASSKPAPVPTATIDATDPFMWKGPELNPAKVTINGRDFVPNIGERHTIMPNEFTPEPARLDMPHIVTDPNIPEGVILVQKPDAKNYLYGMPEEAASRIWGAPVIEVEAPVFAPPNPTPNAGVNQAQQMLDNGFSLVQEGDVLTFFVTSQVCQRA